MRLTGKAVTDCNQCGCEIGVFDPVCPACGVTRKAVAMTDENVVYYDPLAHPDFVQFDDDRPSIPHEKPVVYVPMLAHLLQRLGGPTNAHGWHSDGSGENAVRLTLDDSDTVILVARIYKSAPGLPGPQRTGFCLSDWHPAESELAIIFSLPERWHLGEWQVDAVGVEDISSTSERLDALVAGACDRHVGRKLAEQNRWIYAC
jgi:hypothetical protein